MTTHSTDLMLDDDVKEMLTRMADEQKRSASEVVRDLIARQSANDDAWLKALDEGIADADAGRVVDGDKVDAWLASWGSDDELAPPSCE